MNKEHTISVLFTRYYSTFSNFVYWISGRGYTHASIALDDENEYYYSFNFRGFCQEYPKKHRKKSSKSVCYRIVVSDESYIKMKQMIDELKENEQKLGYCRIGVFLCLVHIAHKFQNRYFCSQFVAEMLELVEGVTLNKKPTLYFPNQLCEELKEKTCVKEIAYNLV